MALFKEVGAAIDRLEQITRILTNNNLIKVEHLTSEFTGKVCKDIVIEYFKSIL